MVLIAAVNADWGIGYQDELLVRISTDMKRFRALTLGKTVVMGRITLKTMPGGKPLEGRENIVLSRDPNLQIPGATICHSAEGLKALIAHRADDAVFVIGGESVYRLLLPHCSQALLTRFWADVPADKYLPDLDAHPEWEPVWSSEKKEENGIPFQYVTYAKKIK